MPVTKHQLAAAILSTAQITERCAIAAFILDDATEFGTHPFSRTSAATVHHTWGAQDFEFRAMEVRAIGLSSLLVAVSALPGDTLLMQELLRSGAHTLNVVHHGDACRIVGAVLYGRPRIPLPELQIPRIRSPVRGRRATTQLDLFAGAFG